MDKKHLVCRKGAAIGMARAPTSAEAGLIREGPARRYKVAGSAARLPFMLPDKGAAGDDR